MAKERSEKCPVESAYGGGWISFGQFLAEKICERVARREKAELPPKFWGLPRWGTLYRSQVTAASKLLQQYSAETVYAALQSKPGQKILSLRVKALRELLAEGNFEVTEVAPQQSSCHNQQLRPPLCPKKSLLGCLTKMEIKLDGKKEARP